MPRKTTKHRRRRGPVYRSSIPADATEIVVSRYASGSKESADYYVNGQQAGRRYWDEDGHLEYEWGYRGDGVRHGYEYEFAPNGQVTFKSRNVDGREHGKAQQWNDKGQLLVSYTKRFGVGLDLWCDNLSGELSEERYCPAPNRLGYERWWKNRRAIWREAFWLDGCGWHGIEREWNNAGRLARGFPKYFVRNVQVTKRQYIRATANEPLLPKFVAAENRPSRKLPQGFLTQRAAERRRRNCAAE
jgi:hypothetical protein